MVRVSLTPTQYLAKTAEVAAKEGISLAQPGAAGGAAGIAVRNGVVIAYSYDGMDLTATILHHPFLVPESVIESRLKNWLSA